MRFSRTSTAALGLLLISAVAPAEAARHLMKVVEVYVGPASDSDAQYIVLQMYAGGQNQVGGHAVQVYNSTDTIVGNFQFASAVPSGTNQDKILLATGAAETRFSVSADLAMTAVIPAAGGKICFDRFDCVSWGNYVGDANSPSPSGTPFNASEGLSAGSAIARDISAGNAGQLENSDDTNSSIADFAVAAAPQPTNNAGTVGSESSGSGSGDGGSGAGGGTGDTATGSGGGGGGGGFSWLSLLALGVVAGLRRRRLAA